MEKVLLCSASPRRRALLTKLVSRFDLAASQVEERSDYLRPHLRVMDLARKKGREARGKAFVVIASDTLVYRKGKYYGKPSSREEARQMLRELSGRRHSVYTGAYVATSQREILFYDKADVTFRSLSDEAIERYLNEYAPFDKAGAYGIQDGVVVKAYRGSFDTIMGLPTELLGKVLEEIGVRDVYE